MLRRATMAAALLLAGCGDDDDPIDPGSLSRFEATIEPSTPLASLDGGAGHIAAPQAPAPAFQLRFWDDEVSGSIVLRRDAAGLPGAGTYEVVPRDDLEDPADFRGTAVWVAPGENFLREYELRSGTVVVESVDEDTDVITGTIELRAAGAGNGLPDVFITGEFTAPPYSLVVD